MGLGVLLVVLILGAGWAVNRAPSVPWSCDDTRFNDTTPTGRGVVGPAVSAPPGCGGRGL
ncbi:MAG: hypothetical protein IT306_19070 [Chloroflexi bacterium]|nr:hypothetical protein [Chloroflexota bacterium]